MTVDTLLAARWVIPVEPERAVLEHHTLALGNGHIIDILPAEQAAARYPHLSAEHFDQHVLIPGLINCHTHAAMSLLRGIADDQPLMTWLTDHIWPLEQRWVSEAFVQDGTELAVAEMLRGGITCFNDMYFFPETTARTAAAAGMRAVVGMIVLDFPSNFAADANDYLIKAHTLHEQWQDHPLIRTAFAPHAPYTVADEPLRQIRQQAEAWNIPVHMHVHETRDEVETARREQDITPLTRLKQLGLLNRRFVAVHMTQLSPAEIDDYAATGGSVVHCPESNLKLASGFCPVARLLEAGVNVALGTDGAASNNDLDVMGEMRIGALLAKAVAQDATAVPAHTALRMATLNGARALGLAHETGSLIPGKSADITAIRLDTLETQPLFDPLSDLVYAASRHQVSDVWVRGQRLLKNRHLTTLDSLDIINKAALWRDRLTNRNT
jgi:5-methylthioadenosine/S-adenosylhomocysteine deaminase